MKGRCIWNGRKYLWFLLLSLLGMLAFYFVPYLASFYYATTDAAGTFIGLRVIQRTLSNEAFHIALGNTARFMAVCVPLNILLPFVLAYLIHTRKGNSGAFITIFMLPLVIPSGASVFFWKVIFQENGLINKIIHQFGGEPVHWFQSETVLWVVVIAFLCKNVGFNMVLYLAGLRYIPREYYEVTAVEGGGRWASLGKVTFVYLEPSFSMVFVLTNSFMSAQEAAARYASQSGHHVELTLWPDQVTLAAYEDALLNDPATTRLFLNSVLLTVPILLGQLIVSPLAAYAFEMTKFKGKEVLYTLYVVVMLMPMQLLMVPHYITAELLGYNNTWWAIILPAIFAPFGTFLLRQQMKGMDRSQLEAAQIEGANEWQVFRKAVLPTVRPTMAALAVLTFADCWNVVDQAVVFIKNTYDMPLSVYLSELASGQPGLICATACVYMFPAVLLFLWGHDSLAHGIALSSMEGKV